MKVNVREKKRKSLKAVPDARRGGKSSSKLATGRGDLSKQALRFLPGPGPGPAPCLNRLEKESACS